MSHLPCPLILSQHVVVSSLPPAKRTRPAEGQGRRSPTPPGQRPGHRVGVGRSGRRERRWPTSPVVASEPPPSPRPRCGRHKGTYGPIRADSAMTMIAAMAMSFSPFHRRRRPREDEEQRLRTPSAPTDCRFDQLGMTRREVTASTTFVRPSTTVGRSALARPSADGATSDPGDPCAFIPPGRDVSAPRHPPSGLAPGDAPGPAMTASAAAGPAHWAWDVVLVDGGTAHVRPIDPTDGPALVAFHEGLSPETVSAKPALDDTEVERFTHVDHDARVALVAELGDRLVGVARYDRTADEREAEVAFVVADEHQGRGIGTVLLEHLAAAARERGITRFVAETLPDNRRMLEVFRAAGFDERTRVRRRCGARRAGDRADRHGPGRDRGARAPRRGARRWPDCWRPARSRSSAPAATRPPWATRCCATCWPAASPGRSTRSTPAPPTWPRVKAYPTVLDVPDAVDLAVIAVPAAAVARRRRAVRAERASSGLVVLSAGFGEVGRRRGARRPSSRDLARRNGMRLVGPNCIGVANTAVGLDATFSPYAPAAGPDRHAVAVGRPGHRHPRALGPRSGSACRASCRSATRPTSAATTCCSTGRTTPAPTSCCSTSSRSATPASSAASPGACRAASRSWRSRAAARPPACGPRRRTPPRWPAPTSPSTRCSARPASIRVDTLDELFDMALLLGSQPLPAGRRVAIVGNSGGPGILATDACDGAGLEVPELGADTQAALRAIVDPNAAVANPVDLVASATPAVYEQALRLVLADEADRRRHRHLHAHLRRTAGRASPRCCRRAAQRRDQAGASAASWPAPELPPLLRRRRAQGADVPGLRRRPSRPPGPWPGRRPTPSGGAGRPGRCPSSTGSTSTAPRSIVDAVAAAVAGRRLAAGRPTSTSCSTPPACRACAPCRSRTVEEARRVAAELGLPRGAEGGRAGPRPQERRGRRRLELRLRRGGGRRLRRRWPPASASG